VRSLRTRASSLALSAALEEVMRRLVAFVAALVLGSPAFGEPPAGAEAELRLREQEWAAAIQRHDSAAAARFLTDSYALVFGVEGQKIGAVPRARWLETLDKSYRVESWHIDDLQATILGDIAVVVMLYTQKATIGGIDRSGQFVITDIWVKQAGEWKVTQRISSRPGAPPPPTMPTSPHK
jgi:ketosteroid isomerase-like protein